MKNFQITDANNNPITIGKLDEEAAKFWNKPVDEKYYAHPFIEEIETQLAYPNWFDIIGRSIANQGNYTSGWNNVIHTMMAEYLGTAILGKEYKVPEFEDTDHNEKLHLPVNIEERIYAILQGFKPFVELIRHWESKGYKPVSLEKEIKDMEKKSNSIPRERQLSADELAAIEKAKEFKLENEVRYCILELGMSPEEALREWDI